MNSLKTVVIVVVLAVVAGAVYVLINNNSATTTPPSELADGWSDSPNVEIPEPEVSVPPFDRSGPGSSSDASSNGADGLAPPFSADEPGDPARGGGMAPPFSPTDSPDRLAGQSAVSGTASDGAPSEASPFDATPPGTGPGEVREAFARFMEAAREDLEQGRLAEVHETLSLWYDNPQLTPEEDRQLTDLLDQVAGMVIYSQEHLMERPYVVKSGDTLQRIARAYGVPWQLLAKINGITDPESLTPGQELKVVRGPFDAVIDLDNHEMTLKLRGLYAGRFRIGVGGTQEELEGTYFVEDKVVEPDASANPLGRYRIQLNDRIGIHGTDDPERIGTDGGPGNISLGERDIEDVHDILSIGSRVQILR
jgi:hypothetical protein